MAHAQSATECRELKKGEIYVCVECGIEMQVVKECDHPDASSGVCNSCTFTCCGGPLKLKA